MAAGPIGAPPAPPLMAGGGADEPWANYRPYHGTQAIGAPPEAGGATGAADEQQEERGWGPAGTGGGAAPTGGAATVGGRAATGGVTKAGVTRIGPTGGGVPT
eukprot:15470549-Alexandrium_andersonii.AAC.1